MCRRKAATRGACGSSTSRPTIASARSRASTPRPRRALVREADDLKAQRNRASELIAQAKRRGEDAAADIARQREVGDRIKVLDGELRTIDDELEGLVAEIPNLPHPSVPPGTSDA